MFPVTYPRSSGSHTMETRPLRTDVDDEKLFEVKAHDFSFSHDDNDDEDIIKVAIGKRPLKKLLIDLAIWLPLTAYAIALMVLGKGQSGYTLAILVYVFISLRLLARHVSMSRLIYGPLGIFFDNTFGRATAAIPENLRVPGLLAATGCALLLTAILSPVNGPYSSVIERIQSFVGIIVLLVVMALTSAVSVCQPTKIPRNSCTNCQIGSKSYSMAYSCSWPISPISHCHIRSPNCRWHSNLSICLQTHHRVFGNVGSRFRVPHWALRKNKLCCQRPPCNCFLLCLHLCCVLLWWHAVHCR